ERPQRRLYAGQARRRAFALARRRPGARQKLPGAAAGRTGLLKPLANCPAGHGIALASLQAHMSDRDFSPPVLASVPSSPPAAPRSSSQSHVWQNGDQASFKDLVAIVNPLQHIPIVGSIYRAATGDDIGFMPRVIGGAL